mgnify:CR=1 FL=1
MKIAICDNDINCLKKSKNAVYEYLNNRNIDSVVDEFTSGDALLKSNFNYLLLILEYDIGDLNGLETAKLFRIRNPQCAIIFLSGCSDFVFDSFKVNPYRFLLKPLKKDALFGALDDYFGTKSNDRPVWVKSGDDTVCFNTGDIYYIEADNKNCIICLEGISVHCNKTMARVYGALPKNHFCKINRAFVVNFDYISAYSNDSIYLSNGESLPLSRNYYKSFKKEYLSYANPCVL